MSGVCNETARNDAADRAGRTDGVAAVSFDAGGTLLFPHPSVGAVYARVLGRHGFSYTAQELDDAFRLAWDRHQAERKATVSEHGEKAWWRAVVTTVLCELGYREAFDAAFEDLWESFADPGHWRVQDGTSEVFEALKQRGVKVALLSNWDYRLRGILEGVGLLEAFDAVAISSEVGVEKPDTRIFRHLEKQLGVEPARILHVGDSIHHDVYGADAAGWLPVLLADAGESETGVHRIARLAELLDLLDGPLPGPNGIGLSALGRPVE